VFNVQTLAVLVDVAGCFLASQAIDSFLVEEDIKRGLSALPETHRFNLALSSKFCVIFR
jgi:hypothetical protein